MRVPRCRPCHPCGVAPRSRIFSETIRRKIRSLGRYSESLRPPCRNMSRYPLFELGCEGTFSARSGENSHAEANSSHRFRQSMSNSRHPANSSRRSIPKQIWAMRMRLALCSPSLISFLLVQVQWQPPLCGSCQRNGRHYRRRRREVARDPCGPPS